MSKLTPSQFVIAYKPYAVACHKVTGLHYHASLTQAALESGWGEYMSGDNNLFGIKDTDGVNGNEALIQTTEIMNTPNAKFPVIISVSSYGKKWLYKIKDYFRKYKTPEESFTDHAKFFVENGRYSRAWNARGDAEEFLRQVARAGYATDPEYESKLIATLRWFQKHS